MIMKLTAQQIEDAKSAKGGFTRATLADWGVPWPPTRGWRAALLAGRPIPAGRNRRRRKKPNRTQPVKLAELENHVFRLAAFLLERGHHDAAETLAGDARGAARYLARPLAPDCEISPALIVSIDIKPGSDPNCFNNDGHGVIPVTILGSDGSGEFDALDVTQIDVESLNLQGELLVAGNNKLMAHLEDVNGDGIDDLVVQIEDQDGVFQGGEAETTLTGETFDGTAIEGSDTICITQ